MRKIVLSLLLCLPSVSLYATEVTLDSPAQISITIPQHLPEVVAKTLQEVIQERLPSEAKVSDRALMATLETSLLSEAKVSDRALMATPESSLLSVSALDTSNWEHTVTVKVVYADEKITSLLMTTYEYMGGAHGSTSRIGLVIDTATGKKLTLEDFYLSKKLTLRLSLIWQKQIINRLELIMGKKLVGLEKSWIRDGSNDISNYQSFVLTPTMLTVYGQEYQHNAYAYGTQTLNYPRYKLADIAK